LTARRNELCPTKIIRSRHSALIERTKRSAYAFRFGERGGNRMTSVPLSRIIRRNCAVYFVSRSMIRYCLARSAPLSISPVLPHVILLPDASWRMLPAAKRTCEASSLLLHSRAFDFHTAAIAALRPHRRSSSALVSDVPVVCGISFLIRLAPLRTSSRSAPRR
jgi:hypothetical protein